MTARVADKNGYIEIKRNPISKVGVFPYSGAQLGLSGDDAGRIFNVLRPAEELFSDETVESFRLLPFIDEHAMLGSEELGRLPAEKKGVHGTIGESIEVDPPYLRANVKIFAESLKSAIDSGKIELSPGYFCKYEFTSGEFEGQSYDAVQRQIRGNHLALVSEGRSGADVAVLDKMTFTIDAKEVLAMADEEKTNAEGSGGELKDLLDKLKVHLKDQEEIREMLKEAGLKFDSEDESEGEEIASADADEYVRDIVSKLREHLGEDEKIAAALKEAGLKLDSQDESAGEEIANDTDGEHLAALDSRIKKIEKMATGMDSAIIANIANRDTLASKLSDFVGVFDHKNMTTAQVAKYGCEKLGIKCPAGTEMVALDAYMVGRTPDHKAATHTFGMDSGVNIASSWAAQGGAK